MVVMSSVHVVNISVKMNNIGDVSNKFFMQIIKSLYVGRFINGGYIINVIEVIDYSRGVIHWDDIDYVISVVFEMVMVTPGNILEQCVVENIDRQGNIMFLSLYGIDVIKIMMLNEDIDSKIRIGKKIDVIILVSEATHMSTFAQVIAKPIMYTEFRWIMSSYLYGILGNVTDGTTTTITDDYSPELASLSKLSHKTKKIKSMFVHTKTQSDKREIQAMIQSFDTNTNVVFINDIDELKHAEHVTYALERNAFIDNNLIPPTSGDGWGINFMISSTNLMRGKYYILYTSTSIPQERLNAFNAELLITFINKYIMRLKIAYELEEYVVRKKINWKNEIAETAKRYNMLFNIE